jgi:hypothetical protein
LTKSSGCKGYQGFLERNPPRHLGGYGSILKTVDFVERRSSLRAVSRNLNLNLLLNALLLTGAAVGF